jgi:hypothetical protein
VTPSDKSVWYGARAEPDDRSPARVAASDCASAAVEVAGGPQRKYRFTEERIYADVPLLVLGELTRFQSGADEDERDDESMPGPAFQDAHLGAEGPSDISESWEDEALVERIDAATARAARFFVSRGSGQRPFILSTTLQAIHAAQQEMGSQAALSLAPAPLLVAVFLLWVRFA